MSVPGNHPASKKVINIETGEIFPSIKVVNQLLGYKNKGYLSRKLGGKVKNGTPYRYLEDIKKQDASDNSQ